MNCQSYNSTLRLIHTALKYLFQLFENLICRHTGCQQLFQHSFGLDLLSNFSGLRFGGNLLGLQLCDCLFGLLDLCLLRF